MANSSIDKDLHLHDSIKVFSSTVAVEGICCDVWRAAIWVAGQMGHDRRRPGAQLLRRSGPLKEFQTRIELVGGSNDTKI
jgi:hypothetical protein